MIRKLVAIAAPVSLSAALVAAKSTEIKAEDKSNILPKCKRSELPIYTPLHDTIKRHSSVNTISNPKYDESEHFIRNNIENGVRTVRVEVSKAYGLITSQTDSVKDFVRTGREHSKFVFDYLNEPDNTFPRVGAIAIGGLAGLIFSLRGGFIRRILYTSLGAGGIASICYPKEAGEYLQIGLDEAKKGTTIGYNFIFGVKPGDNVNSPEWPKIPLSWSELTDSFSDLAKSAKDTITSSTKK